MAQNVLTDSSEPSQGEANCPGIREAAITAALDQNWPRERIVYTLGCSRRQLQRWVVEAQLERWVNGARPERQAQVRIGLPTLINNEDENKTPAAAEARWGGLQDLPKAKAPTGRCKPSSSALAWLTTSADNLVCTFG